MMRHWIRYLGWGVMVATLFKVALVVFADPMVGYANNADFARSSECVGVWHAQDGAVAPIDHKRPHNELLYKGGYRRSVCLKSSDNLFPRLARLGIDQGDTFDFRRVAAWKFGALALAAAVIGFVLRHRPATLLGAAVAFYLVFGDMAVLPYFNSLYTDFSVVAGLYTLLAACIWVACTPRRPGAKTAVGVFAVAGFWLACGKEQYSPLAGFLLACAALIWLLRWREARPALALALLAVAAPLAYQALNPPKLLVSSSMNMANRVNAFLWAVLPAAQDKPATLRALGLPPHCEAAIGKNWFVPGFQENNPCPEIAGASRLRLAAQFFVEPGLFFGPMSNAIRSFRPLYPDHLGRFEDPRDADSPWYRTMVRTSMTHWSSALSDTAFVRSMVVFMVLGLAAGLCALVLLGRRGAMDGNGQRWLPACAFWGLGSLTVVYALASSVFGDGYSDFPKHAVGGLVGLAFGIVGLALLVCNLLGWRRQRASTG